MKQNLLLILQDVVEWTDGFVMFNQSVDEFADGIVQLNDVQGIGITW